jgi:hypothetical protein
MDRSREAAVPKIGKNAERWCDSYVSAEKSEKKSESKHNLYGFSQAGSGRMCKIADAPLHITDSCSLSHGVLEGTCARICKSWSQLR